jgi:hypothetical protein
MWSGIEKFISVVEKLKTLGKDLEVSETGEPKLNRTLFNLQGMAR